MSDWTYSDELADGALEPSARMLVALAGGGWGVIGASVAGRRRGMAGERVSEPGGAEAPGQEAMQDACAAAVSIRGEVIAAIADGAGSARLGGLGARIAALTAVQAMTQLTYWHPASNLLPYENADAWRDAAFRVMRCVRAMLVRAARERGARRDDLACTLTVVYANPVMVLAAQLGDGRAAVLWDDGDWEAITTPQRGEHAGETQFVTSNGWRRDAQQVSVRMLIGRVEGLALLTDGCERVAYECQAQDGDTGRYQAANRPHAPFLTPNVRTLRRMMEREAGPPVVQVATMWERFLRDGTPELPALRDEADDKTLLLAVRCAPNASSISGGAAAPPSALGAD